MRRAARNRFERSRQILAWLESEWPCGRPVMLSWRAEVAEGGEKFFGETYRRGKTIHIVLSRRKCRTWDRMVETLIHEYVHAIQWGPASVEDHPKCDHHPPAFYAQQGEIMNRWNHGGGDEESKRFTVE